MGSLPCHRSTQQPTITGRPYRTSTPHGVGAGLQYLGMLNTLSPYSYTTSRLMCTPQKITEKMKGLGLFFSILLFLTLTITPGTMMGLSVQKLSKFLSVEIVTGQNLYSHSQCSEQCHRSLSGLPWRHWPMVGLPAFSVAECVRLVTLFDFYFYFLDNVWVALRMIWPPRLTGR